MVPSDGADDPNVSMIRVYAERAQSRRRAGRLVMECCDEADRCSARS